MKDAKTFWDNYAPRYARSRIARPADYQKKLQISRDYLTPQSRVLEIGCGTGGTAIEHAPYVASILATDISAEMIRIAEQNIHQSGVSNIECQCGTLATLHLQPGYYDVIFALNLLHLLEDVPATLQQLQRLLKPGGVLISSTALVAEAGFFARLLIRLMQRVGLAPHVSLLSREQLLNQLNTAGFETAHDWQLHKGHVFLVSRCGNKDCAE